jgi:hypothetical protein
VTNQCWVVKWSKDFNNIVATVSTKLDILCRSKKVAQSSVFLFFFLPSSYTMWNSPYGKIEFIGLGKTPRGGFLFTHSRVLSVCVLEIFPIMWREFLPNAGREGSASELNHGESRTPSPTHSTGPLLTVSQAGGGVIRSHSCPTAKTSLLEMHDCKGPYLTVPGQVPSAPLTHTS